MDKNKGLIKYTSAEISSINTQLQIGNSILSEIDLYNEFLDIKNIRNAVELAINARYNLDLYFDPQEIFNLNTESLIHEIYSELKECSFNIKQKYSFEYLKNLNDNRYVLYLEIKSYSIRFLVSLILYKRINFSKLLFHDHNAIFSIQTKDIFKIISDSFLQWQKEIISKRNYEWIVMVDISNYYQSLDSKILNKKILSHLGNISVNRIPKLVEIYIEQSDINIGNWCDNFLQDIMLFNLDQIMESEKWLYGRFTDDIRVFAEMKRMRIWLLIKFQKN